MGKRGRNGWLYIHTDHQTLAPSLCKRTALFVYFIRNEPFNRQLVILPCRWVPQLLFPVAHGHLVESEPISCLFHVRDSFPADEELQSEELRLS